MIDFDLYDLHDNDDSDGFCALTDFSGVRRAYTHHPVAALDVLGDCPALAHATLSEIAAALKEVGDLGPFGWNFHRHFYNMDETTHRVAYVLGWRCATCEAFAVEPHPEEMLENSYRSYHRIDDYMLRRQRTEFERQVDEFVAERYDGLSHKFLLRFSMLCSGCHNKIRRLKFLLLRRGVLSLNGDRREAQITFLMYTSNRLRSEAKR